MVYNLYNAFLFTLIYSFFKGAGIVSELVANVRNVWCFGMFTIWKGQKISNLN